MTDAVVEDYGEAQLDALRRSLLAVAFAGIVAFWVARRLPGRPLRPAAGDPTFCARIIPAG